MKYRKKPVVIEAIQFKNQSWFSNLLHDCNNKGLLK
jgi:hypothetical protein